MTNVVYRIFTDKMGGRTADEFIGRAGDVFFDPSSGELRRSDGVTAGGIALTQSSTSVDQMGNVIAGDSSNNTVTVEPGADHIIPNFSGMLLVNDHYDGGVELWICGGNGTNLISATKQTVGDMTIDGQNNGYKWTNTSNLTGPFTFTVIKTRNGS